MELPLKIFLFLFRSLIDPFLAGIIATTLINSFFLNLQFVLALILQKYFSNDGDLSLIDNGIKKAFFG